MRQGIYSPGTGLAGLSILTFFLLFGAGAVMPIMSLYLTQYLHFSGAVAGSILAVSALGVVAAPLLGSVVADRFIAAERLLSLCLLASALLIFLLSKVDSFAAVLVLYAGHTLAFGPVMTLNNVVIFHHVERRGGDYGRIRVFGTLGWIVVAWVFSWFWLRGGQGRVLPERLPDALVLSAFVYAAIGVFSLFLPSTKASGGDDYRGLVPRDALTVIFDPHILALVMAVFLCFLTDRFYYYGAAIFLKQSGFDESRLLPVLSFGQILEIPAMALLGRLLSKLEIKKVLLLGLVCNGCRYLLFTLSGGRPELIIAGITFHGLAYAFFFSAAFVCLDAFVKTDNRAGVHLLFTILTTGLGTVAGNLLAGWVAQYARLAGGGTDFRLYWALCLVTVLMAFICIAFLFKSENEAPLIATAEGFLDEDQSGV